MQPTHPFPPRSIDQTSDVESFLCTFKMDWFALTSEVLAKKQQGFVQEQDFLVENTTNGFFEGTETANEKLSPLEAAALSCILETASLQLRIIDAGTCDFSPESSSFVARKKILEVIEEAEGEMKNSGIFKALFEKVKGEAETKTALKLLTKSIKDNKVRMRDLRTKLKDGESKKLRDINEKQEIIASLKDRVHEEITKNDVKLRYVDRLETARQGQSRIRCQNAESELEIKLQLIADKCDAEIRVHDEMTTFLVLEEQELLREVEKWKGFYENEMRRRKEKIKLLKTRRKEQKILLHDLSQLYEERQKEINDYLDFKKKLREQQERERFINETATKIQAWWRGTMVRKGLGPFKKKKKAGKEGKKK